jgi:catechol 2,3-dioxygenase-like lactoylglutathione lyase family enzyme
MRWAGLKFPLDRKIVDEFHAAATAAGGKCNGQPGLRPHYHPNYYGAFVHDPAGNNVEVVCHLPE